MPFGPGQALVILVGRITLSSWIVHLSFVMEQSAVLPAELEEQRADVDDGPRIGEKGSSQKAIGNSTILSIRGALMETSRESRLPRTLVYKFGVALALVLGGVENFLDGA